jgi:BCD family chlorophyll transporter-like MFS transporter
MKVLHLASKTIRLSLLRVGIGWMFALLTFNFNRVSITELGAVAVLVTSLLSLHYFLSPMQVFWGRLADRFPLWGYRRTPYILLSTVLGSLLFLVLPTLATYLASAPLLAAGPALLLFVLFGLAMAANGSAVFALVAETTSPRERGAVVGITQTALVISAIASAGIAKSVMPEYDPAQMQVLYNLTPLIAGGTTLLGLLGLERRISPAEHATLLRQAESGPASAGSSTLALTWRLLRTQRQVRLFFWFVLCAILGIFLQDGILEVFGAEVFNLSLAETTTFTQAWGSGMLGGMLLVGLLTWAFPVPKKLIATVGGIGTVFGLAALAHAATSNTQALVLPTLLMMGLCVGLFNIGAMSMMMEMTVEGHTGLYMGMWGMAQGLGNGLAMVLGGALHTGLIGTNLLAPSSAYGIIFSLSAVLMTGAVLLLRASSPQEFQALDAPTMGAALAADAP